MSSAKQTDWSAYDRPAVQRGVLHLDGSQATAQLTVEGMHCSACARRIEREVGALAGVTRVAVNGATKRMQMSWDLARLPFSRLLGCIAQLGFEPRVLGFARGDTGREETRKALKRLAVAGFGMAQAMSFAFALYAGAAHGMEAHIETYLRLATMLVSIPVVFYSGAPFFTGAWRDLRGRRLGMDVPVSLAVVLAFAASVFNTLRGAGEVYFESVTMFVFLLLLARWVEMRTRHRSGSMNDALAQLLPQTVQRLRDGRRESVRAADLTPGDELLVPAGGLIAADGRVLEGSGRVDESLLTGESTPLYKTNGDSVMGGSLNLGDPLRVAVTATGPHTVLAGIVRLLERAQTERPRLGRLADRAAAWFVGAVLLLAAGVAASWWFVDPARAFPATLSVLVVTCPCALSLAMPAVLAAATTRLARLGLLVTHADAIEALAVVRHCVFDKTGTLTDGAPRLAGTMALGSRSTNECLQIAAALESHSEHPLSLAFALPTPLTATRVGVARGRGLEGTIDGRRYRIGQLEYVCRDPVDRDCNPAISDAHGEIFLGDDRGLLAAFTIDASLRPGAIEAVRALQAQGLQVEIASGDHAHAVARVAMQLHIDRWHARLAPEDKLERLRELGDTPGAVMIGDGINDAPVLGAARVSIAMGGGSALAHVSADAILMSQSLAVLPEGIRISRQALAIMRQNLWWATGYNLLAVPLAALGMVPPWAAAIGMSLSSMIVVLNAARLARPASPPAAASANAVLREAHP